MSDQCQPLGYKEIAALLEVKERTVTMWKWQDKLPPPDYDSIHGFPAWDRDTIVRWAGETGRARSRKLAKEYEALTGQKPSDRNHGGRPKTEVADG